MTNQPEPGVPLDAAAWDARVRFPLCTRADRASFEAWNNANPEHKRAFDRLQAIVSSLKYEKIWNPALRDIRDRHCRDGACSSIAAPKTRSKKQSLAAPRPPSARPGRNSTD